ncbi:terminase small subunit [Paracoccus tibetensis]|uniref:Phage DNA packaging protein, Nu1 subunit of terminase n=1 Tax=Paracoccus tibetensis TaxID=336292 RepID=A0A1G5HFD4_9RHOB|nr:terminase small subunit [Paracoccus tibetensis]SCY61728.1 Protein of unknown function [Paracoccus tibetensis]
MTSITLADGSVLEVSRYPLPEGVEDDGTPLNRTQLARAFGVSENTVGKWAGQGMPALSAGQNGVAYEFSLAQCWAWKQDRDARLRSAKQRGDQLAAQAALAFRNLDEDQAEEEGELTAADLRQWSEAEYHRNRVAEQRGDLVRVDRMRTLIEDVFVTFGAEMDTLPDFAEMEFGLSPAQVAKMQERCDQMREEVRRQIEAVLGRSSVVRLARQGEMDLG